jgi:hypothetical protein
MARQASVEVLEVSQEEREPQRLVGGRIKPLTEEGSLIIVGWVLGRESRAKAVELMCGDEVIARADVNIDRPDVADWFPDISDAAASGFRLKLEPEGKGEDKLLARAVLEDGAIVPIESVRVKVSQPGRLRRLLHSN